MPQPIRNPKKQKARHQRLTKTSGNLFILTVNLQKCLLKIALLRFVCMIFFFQTSQILVTAFITAKTLNLTPRLDPNRILRGNIGSADRVFDHNPVSSHFFLLFGFFLPFLFLVANKQFVDDKGRYRENNEF